MDPFLVELPAEGAASSNGSGRMVPNGTRYGMMPESDVFQKLVRGLSRDVGGSVALAAGEAEPTAEGFEGAATAAILDGALAVAVGGRVGPGDVPARPGAALAIRFLAGNDSRGEGSSLLTAAGAEPALEAPISTDTGDEQATDDPHEFVLEVMAPGQASLIVESAWYTTPAGQVDPGWAVIDRDGATVVEFASAQPQAAVWNRERARQPVSAFREEAGVPIWQAFGEEPARLPDQPSHPGAELQARSADVPGSVRSPVDLALPASPGRVMGGEGVGAPGSTGLTHQVDAVRFVPDHVARTETAANAGSPGDGETHDQPAAQKYDRREDAGMPTSEDAVPVHQTEKGVSIALLEPRTPSAPAAGVAPPDPARESVPLRAEMAPRPVARSVDGLDSSGGAKTVHTVQVNLEQEELGRLRVRVVLADSTVHTHVTTEYADLGQFLMNRRDQLESALHTAGLDVGQFRVHIDRQGSGQSADDRMTRSFGDDPHEPRGRREPMRAAPDVPIAAEPHGLSVFA